MTSAKRPRSARLDLGFSRCCSSSLRAPPGCEPVGLPTKSAVVTGHKCARLVDDTSTKAARGMRWEQDSSLSVLGCRREHRGQAVTLLGLKRRVKSGHWLYSTGHAEYEVAPALLGPSQ